METRVTLVQHHPFNCGQPRGLWKVVLTYIMSFREIFFYSLKTLNCQRANLGREKQRLLEGDREGRGDAGQGQMRCCKGSVLEEPLDRAASRTSRTDTQATGEATLQGQRAVPWLCFQTREAAAGPGKSPHDRVQSMEVWLLRLQAVCFSLSPTQHLSRCNPLPPSHHPCEHFPHQGW